MRSRYRSIAALLVALAAATASAQQASQATRRQPADHPDRGLPHPDAVWLPYHEDADHVLNRIWRRLYLVRCVPAEVAGALGREGGAVPDFFREGWYFAKRPGEAEDARWFGGDGRQLVREGFAADEAAQLTAELAAVDGEVAAALRARPRLAVWFQHDLLRLARRLLRTGENPELLAPLLACAERVALPRAQLVGDALATVGFDALGAVVPDFDAGDFVEVQRRSTRLFDAQWTQLWSRVFVRFPADGPVAFEDWLAASRAAGDELPPVPIGSLAVLLQGIVAVDAAGAPAATGLVIEVRTQRLQNRDPLGADNATTTRDGVQFAVYSLERETLRRRGAGLTFADFRAVPMDDQELFRDYGTRKHTTYAAQCTLCHRRSHAPQEPLAGFSALRPSSQPRPVEAADERLRQAESELARFLEELRTARRR